MPKKKKVAEAAPPSDQFPEQPAPTVEVLTQIAAMLQIQKGLSPVKAVEEAWRIWQTTHDACAHLINWTTKKAPYYVELSSELDGLKNKDGIIQFKKGLRVLFSTTAPGSQEMKLLDYLKFKFKDREKAAQELEGYKAGFTKSQLTHLYLMMLLPRGDTAPLKDLDPSWWEKQKRE